MAVPPRAARIADAAEDAATAFARELASIWRQTERRLIGWLQEATSTGRPTAVLRATQGIQAREAMRRVLRDAGYDTLVLEATDAPLTRLSEAVLVREASVLGAAFPSRIEALKALQTLDLLEEGDHIARQLWKALVRGLLGGESAREIMADLLPLLDLTEAQVATLYDTSVSIFGRQVEALQAGQDPATPFLYAGPDDPLTREFCIKRVGHVYTRQEIDDMDNGQLNNVFLTGGGYNCRHVWLEVVS